MGALLPAAIPPLGLNWATFQAEKGTYTFTGQNASLSKSRVQTAEAGSFTHTGVSATLTKQSSNAGQGAGAPLPCMSMMLESSVQKGFSALRGTIIYTGGYTTLYYGKRITAQKGIFGLAGAPGLSDFEQNQGVASFALTGVGATMGRARPSSAGAFTIPANLYTSFSRTSANTTIMGATPSSLGFTPSTANLVRSMKVTAQPQAFVLNGIPINKSFGFKPLAGSIVLAGPNVTFVKGSVARRRVRIRFVTSQGAPISGPITVEYAFFDQAKPSAFTVPTETGQAQIDANGFLDFEVEATGLGAAQVGYLVVTNNVTGNPELSWKEFSGPVRVI